MLIYCLNMNYIIIVTGVFPQLSSFCQETFKYPFQLELFTRCRYVDFHVHNMYFYSLDQLIIIIIAFS